MYRVGIVTDKGKIEARNYSTKEEVDNFILFFPDTELIIHYRIEKDGELIETERGIIK